MASVRRDEGLRLFFWLCLFRGIGPLNLVLRLRFYYGLWVVSTLVHILLQSLWREGLEDLQPFVLHNSFHFLVIQDGIRFASYVLFVTWLFTQR